VVAPHAVLVGRGSDEAIRLLVRAFCRAGEDAVLTLTPSFGMYAAAAQSRARSSSALPLRPAARASRWTRMPCLRVSRVRRQWKSRVPVLAQQPQPATS